MQMETILFFGLRSPNLGLARHCPHLHQPRLLLFQPIYTFIDFFIKGDAETDASGLGRPTGWLDIDIISSHHSDPIKYAILFPVDINKFTTTKVTTINYYQTMQLSSFVCLLEQL